MNATILLILTLLQAPILNKRPLIVKPYDPAKPMDCLRPDFKKNVETRLSATDPARIQAILDAKLKLTPDVKKTPRKKGNKNVGKKK